MINCPNCKRLMEVYMSKIDKSHYQFLCRECLCYWDMNKIEMCEEDIIELAKE